MGGYTGVAPDQQVPLYRTEFTSAEQTITAAGILTIPHGLGVKPTDVRAYIVCKTAEHGYSVGDEVEVSLSGASVDTAGSSVGYNLSVTTDATNITIRFGNATNSLVILNKTTGARVATTDANWKLVVRAWAEPAPTVPWASASLGTSGYWKDQNTGMIIQWGTIGTSSTGDVTLTFPIAFPNKACAISGNHKSSSATSPTFVSFGTLTNSSVLVAAYNTAGAKRAVNVRWMVIGY